MFYFCRRGRENLRRMTKSTYYVSRDATGKQFLHQKNKQLFRCSFDEEGIARSSIIAANTWLFVTDRDKSDKLDKLDKSDKLDDFDKMDKSDKLDKLDKSDKLGKSDQLDTLD